MIRTRPTRGSHRRAGNILVMFAIGLIGMLAFAALVVDVGLVMLTRRQMQTAVNTAALEGLRFRDDQTVPPDQRDGKQRERTSALVAAVFDDDLNPANGNPLDPPSVSFEGGIPTEDGGDTRQLYASQLIRRFSAPKPSLDTRPSTDSGGDIVVGTYTNTPSEKDPNPSRPHDEWSTLSVTPGEPPDYGRDDFAPGTGTDAFLVRLRRTDEITSGLITEDYPYHRTKISGPVPFLFGRFAIGAEGTEPAAINRRRARGTNVRATAIAIAAPAMTVGVSAPPSVDLTDGRIGFAPFSVEKDNWLILTVGVSATVPVMWIERAVVEPISVGNELAEDLTPSGVSFAQELFIPIHIRIDATGKDHVIGFGRALVPIQPAAPTIDLEKKPGQVGVVNASSAFIVPPSVQPLGAWDEIFVEHKLLKDHVSSHLVKAPARVRAIH